jgi:hypothetical protein
MDYSIIQKILPKIGGSGGEVLDILVRDGFTTFWQ